MPEDCFFVVDDGGDRLTEEQELIIKKLVRDEDGAPDLEKSEYAMRVDTEEFIDRCVAQVRDYRVMVNDEGEMTVKTWSATNNGDNKVNRAFYRIFTREENGAARALLLGAMDRLAGRTTPFREEFDALFAEHPSLLSTS